MPFLYIGLNFYGAFLRKLSKQARIGDSEAGGIAGESLSNIRTVRSFAAEDRELQRFALSLEDSCRKNSHLGFHIGLFQGITNASIGGMILTILYYGGNLVAKGEITGGQLMTYMVATQSAQRSLSMVGMLFGEKEEETAVLFSTKLLKSYPFLPSL